MGGLILLLQINTYNLFDYKIYNEFIEETIISEINLTCHCFRDTRDTAFYRYIEFDMYDFHKKEKKITNAGSSAEFSRNDIIIDAIRFMKELGTFKSWEAIDLFLENRELKNKIKGLENEIKLLKGNAIQ